MAEQTKVSQAMPAEYSALTVCPQYTLEGPRMYTSVVKHSRPSYVNIFISQVTPLVAEPAVAPPTVTTKVQALAYLHMRSAEPPPRRTQNSV